MIGEALLHGVQEALMRPSREPDIDYAARAAIERRQAEIAAMLASYDAAIKLEQLREAAR